MVVEALGLYVHGSLRRAISRTRAHRVSLGSGDGHTNRAIRSVERLAQRRIRERVLLSNLPPDIERDGVDLGG